MSEIKSSNECGGFKPPKGHLDTQMFPECEGTPTDRNIVKKTVEKRKKKKANTNDPESIIPFAQTSDKNQKREAYNMNKIAKHGYPIVSDETRKGIWEEWLDGEIVDKEFISLMDDVVVNGFIGVSQDPSVRNKINKALESVKKTRDYRGSALEISRALTWGKETEESLINKPQKAASNIKFPEKQHFNLKEYRISKKKTPKEHGFMDQCMKENKDKDDPGAYCASIVDKVKGTTKWRGENR